MNKIIFSETWKKVALAIVVVLLVIGITEFQYYQKSQTDISQSVHTTREILYFVRDFNLWRSQDGVEIKLTTNGAQSRSIYSQPRISPDGSMVAYMYYPGEDKMELYVSDAIKFEPKLAANDISDRFNWSSDSKSIYYLANGSGPSTFIDQVFVYTSSIKKISLPDFKNEMIGTFVASGECGGGGDELSRFLTSYEGIINTAGEMNIFDVNDQKGLVLHTSDCQGNSTKIFDLKTGTDFSLIDDDITRSALSPDGTKIASTKGDLIVIVNTASRISESSTKVKGDDIVLLWSNDGKSVYFTGSATKRKVNIKYPTWGIGERPTYYTVRESYLYQMDVASRKIKLLLIRDAYVLRPISLIDNKSALLFSEVENTTETLDPKVNVYSFNFADQSVTPIAGNAAQATFWAK